MRAIAANGDVLHTHEVESGDTWRMASARRAPIENWIGLAIDRMATDVLYVFVEIDIDTPHLVDTIRHNFTDSELRIAVCGTVQFQGAMHAARAALSAHVAGLIGRWTRDDALLCGLDVWANAASSSLLRDGPDDWLLDLVAKTLPRAFARAEERCKQRAGEGAAAAPARGGRAADKLTPTFSSTWRCPGLREARGLRGEEVGRVEFLKVFLDPGGSEELLLGGAEAAAEGDEQRAPTPPVHLGSLLRALHAANGDSRLCARQGLVVGDENRRPYVQFARAADLYSASREARNRPNMDWQEKIHGGILRGLRSISETP